MKQSSGGTTQRIAVVGNQAFTLIRFRGPLIRALLEQGHTVFAFMPDATAEDRDRVRDLGAKPVSFRLDRTGMNPILDMLTLISLIRGFRKHGVQIALCYFIKPVIYGLWAARIVGVTRRYALIEGAGTAFAEDKLWSLANWLLRKIAFGLYRSALQHANKVFVLNRDDAQLFTFTGMVNKSKVVILPGIGIDLQEYEFSGRPDGPTTFLMATRLLGDKGIREFAAAARCTKEMYPEVRFVLLGGVETNPGRISEREVRSWMVDGILEWPGRVDDVQPWLESAHVFVLPSYYREGLPRSTLEAIAKGRAVITTDSVGCKDTVRDGENGFMVPPRDVRALVDAIKRMIQDPQMVARMGVASRRMAEECFDVHVVNRRFLEEMGLNMV